MYLYTYPLYRDFVCANASINLQSIRSEGMLSAIGPRRWETAWSVSTYNSYSSPLCLFKLPVTFSATQLFHTGQPTGYRDWLPLSWQNRQLSVEKLVKLHFSMKAMFSGEAAVFSYRHRPQKPLSKVFFFFSECVIIFVQQQPSGERKSINCALSPSRPSAQVPESQ